ncbi:MAG: hypothetical protein QM739_18770 [Propionivibrio sp.]
MFIGHFGLGFGAKTLAPKTSLGTLLMAAQFIDLLWPVFLLLGLERVHIAPGATRVTPLRFEHYPFSHSLLAVCGWAVLLGGVHFYRRRDRRSAVVIGALVVSHWFLDAVVHQPDLPLLPGSHLLVGLGVWSSLPLTLLIEVPLFLCGVWLYIRRSVASDAVGKWGLAALIVVLLVIYAGNLFGGPPPNAQAIAWAGQLQWLFVLCGYWVDKHRRRP